MSALPISHCPLPTESAASASANRQSAIGNRQSSDIARAYQANAWLRDRFARRPSLNYRPGRSIDIEGRFVAEADNGQLQFHMAPHVFRFLAPGNGFGKTACVAVEVDWWVQGDHPWPAEIRTDRARLIVWACQKLQQWGQIRRDVEAWWTRGWTMTQNPFWRYRWPNGSEVFIITAEMRWEGIQGIQPDLVVVDEECPASLFEELVMRRRGRTRTRYCVSATATRGLQWPYNRYYKPWKAYHEKLGITDERDMMRRQLHRFEGSELADVPGIWFWPQGSHRDNPTATKQTWEFYLANTTGNPALRHVRLYGGYREFSGTPVFDPEALEQMRPAIQPGISGVIQRKGAPLPTTAE